MRRGALVLTLGMAAGAACGNLSNEDLVFLEGVPRAEEVAMAIQDEGNNSNALTGLLGRPASTYGLAVKVAAGFDTVVASTLDFVEALGQDHSPTRRTETSRVWGPVRNVDGNGISLRLEIQRAERADGNPMFTFCLHAGLDTAVSHGASPDCQTPNAGGLRLLTWGTFQPRASATDERAAQGDIHFDFAAINALDGVSDGGGLLTITYDFSDGGRARAIHIDWEREVDDETERFLYDFATNPAGDVRFVFVLREDIFADDGVTGETPQETLGIVACWEGDGPGQAIVAISGGDLPGGETAAATECWDADHLRTYWYLTVESAAYAEEEGDVGLCPAACPDI